MHSSLNREDIMQPKWSLQDPLNFQLERGGILNNVDCVLGFGQVVNPKLYPSLLFVIQTMDNRGHSPVHGTWIARCCHTLFDLAPVSE
eukprot:CAMPEP_0172784872 /NCGR_PEP_ID=MMETSP1074-20121228/205161_1 /TAXON_ID=2916 /ORGANISM="Ceratium fusus, Strain PA161109" /LENGTH=87 /DNA_ID=CAMNT_0013621877 /DNA_START=820 /DNA_END=1083 /DNA_ORIENTATION=+